MGETKTRLTLPEAEAIAAELVDLLRPACERIEIAGSIRRRRPDVGDIEILAVPRLVPVLGIFGPTGEMAAQLDALAGYLESQGRLARRQRINGHAWGPRYKAAVYRGMAVDLFSCLPPAQWGVLYIIRTGPADFSRRLVTDRRHGGLMPEWARVQDGGIHYRAGGDLIETPEESDVWRVLGIEPIAPEGRA